MAAFWLYVLLVATLGLAQSMEPMNICTEQSTAPACVLTFTPWMARDIEPKTTYYETIVTQYLYIIDCKYCSVVNIEDNPTPTGSHSERVTSPTLMVTRVTCMPETTAITRRDIRGFPEDAALEARTVVPDEPIEHAISEQNVNDDIAEDPAPGSWDIMQAINEYRKQIYSAFMAVTLILSGLDRQWMCDGLEDSALQLSLSQQNLYPNQIRNLVCYSAKFGIQFNASTFQVLDQLSSTATSLLLAVQNNLEENALTAELCQDLTLDKSLYTMLQIDNQGIYKVMCTSVPNSTTFTTGSTVISTLSATAGASSSAVTFTSFGSNGSVLVTGTGVGISWSDDGGTGAVSATLTESSWSFGAGNATTTAVTTGGISIGTAASTSWSVGSLSTASLANGTAISASLSGANATTSRGGSISLSASAVGVSSASIGANGTINVGSTGSSAPGSSSLAGNATLIPTTTNTLNGSAASWSFGASGNASFGVTVTAVSPDVTGGAQTPSWSWTTFTNANGSVVISGTAAVTGFSGTTVVTGKSWSWGLNNSTATATGTSGMVDTAVGTGATATWTSLAGNATTVYSYSGMAWTSWVVSSQATIAIITGTAGSIEWGTAEATALITGAGQAATFTIYQIQKTIIVTATAIAQTWSVSGVGSAGVITASGTAGTWTLEPYTSFGFNASASDTGAASSWANASADTTSASSTISFPASINATLTGTATATSSIIGTGVTSIGGNGSVTGIPSAGRPPPPVSVNSSISSLSIGSGIPFVPADLTATTTSDNVSVTVSTSGFANLTSPTVGSAVTSWSGNSTAVINATTVVGPGVSNVSTTVVGTITWSSLASVSTGLVTVTNPVNGSNVTLSLSSPIFTPPKSFSYPGWTTSTT